MAARLVRCTCVWDLHERATARLLDDPFCPASGRHADER